MEDISIKLLDDIKKFFSSNYNDSKKIEQLISKLESENVDYEDAHNFAIEVGKLLAQAFEENIDSISLPNGKMYYNIAKKTVVPMLENSYEIVSDYSVRVQKQLNKKANIGLKAVKPKMNTNRTNGFVEALLKKDLYEEVSYVLKDPVINYTQSIVDDTIKANADIHYDAGRHPVIIRKVSGHACAWCMNLAGSYNYPNDVSAEIYKRHAHCRCKVLYNPADGDYVQDIWNKNKYRNEEVMQNMIENENKEKIYKEYSKRARILDDRSLNERDTLEYLNKQSSTWISDLSNEEKRAITKYTWNGKEKKPRFYERMNAFLRGILIDISEKKILARYSEIISEALQKSTINEDIVVFRTCSEDYFKEYEIGECFQIDQFLSTSITRIGPFARGINYKIYINKNTSGCAFINQLSYYKKQKELLIDKGMFLRVLSRKRNLIEMEVICNG